MPLNPRKVVVVYSGGLDSTTLLYMHRNQGDEVIPLGVNYGQRHGRELDAATRICARLGLPYHLVDLTALRPFLAGSSQTDKAVDVPEGHYAAETMKATVVPNRNMILLSVAMGAALSMKAAAVSYGAHSGDHAIYPDCRPAFIKKIQELAGLVDWAPLEVEAPLQLFTKADIVKAGANLRVPFGTTWSCYKGGRVHCGVCGTCVERIEAFNLAGVQDPTEYEVNGC